MLLLLRAYEISFFSFAGIIPLYMGYGANGTTWFSSELKGRTHTNTTLKSPFSRGKLSSQIHCLDRGDKVGSDIGLSF